jgi:hypothetical protein
MRIAIAILFVFFYHSISAQKYQDDWHLGFTYGNGKEIKNSDYSYANSYFKILAYRKWKTTTLGDISFFFGPEFNKASHQLLNFYFVKPEIPNYEAKRDAFMTLKTIKEGIFHLGMTLRKDISKKSGIYVLASIGPMITDTETERLSKGFAFCDILALGYTLDFKYFALDVRPSFRHTSNAGLKESNAGFNTKNIELGIIFPFTNNNHIMDKH